MDIGNSKPKQKTSSLTQELNMHQTTIDIQIFANHCDTSSNQAPQLTYMSTCVTNLRVTKPNEKLQEESWPSVTQGQKHLRGSVQKLGEKPIVQSTTQETLRGSRAKSIAQGQKST